MTIKEHFIEIEQKEGYLKALISLDEHISNTILSDSIDLETEQEILDFGDYFVDEFEDKTYDERIAYFGEEDSLILSFYDLLVEKYNEEGNFLEECENILISLNREEQQELEKIYEVLQYYPEKKNLYIEYTSNHVFSCEIDENLTKEQELELKGVLARAIKQDAVLLVELQKSKIVTAMLFQDKITKTISKKGIKRIHNIDLHTGEKIKQKGFQYIEANELTELSIKKREE